ncbi:hypothetical protein [Conyzicola sp.]|uniref:hypothetical protein n=1 Tax=Conyzicola sp. TaxID=1969404 RepID=UPI003989DE2E
MADYHSADDLAHLKRDGTAIDIPAWSFGGRPDAAANFAGWDLRGGPGSWNARNAESTVGEKPELLKAIRVGTSVAPSDENAYGRLLVLARYDEMYGRRDWSVTRRLHEYISDNYPGDLTAMMTSFRALVAGAPKAADLPAIAATVMGEWLVDQGVPNASLHLLQTSAVFGNRYGMPRALLHHERPTEQADAFGSSRELVQEAGFGLDAYLEPLVTSLAPHVWGVTAPRAGGVLILSFGRPIAGRRGVSADLISLSERKGLTGGELADGEFAPSAFRETINWWTSRLNLVFSHLTEPSNYQVDGRYNAPSALERIVNFEQICRSCQVVATVDDSHARRLAMFHVLDSLHGLRRNLDLRALTSLSANRKLLDELADAMPTNVQTVLLPRARAAVDALEHVQDGFIPSPRLTKTGLVRPDGRGVETEAPLATAAGEWLKIIRDSQHGYDKTPGARERALLAAHTGYIPARLPDLAWLNLLRFLTFPELLKRQGQ